MSPLIQITTPLTPTKTGLIETIINTAHTEIDTIKITLTTSQAKALYKVGTIRSSEISAIETKLMVAHPETIPSTYSLAQFHALTQEGTDSNTLEAMFLVLAAIAGAHGDIIQNNRMYWALQCLDNARLLGKTSVTIDEIVTAINTEFFNKAGTSKKTASVYSIASSATITIAGVTSGKYFTNHGSTILTFLKVGAAASATITVNPGSGVSVPPTWTKIVVTNVSGMADGAFSLFIS